MKLNRPESRKNHQPIHWIANPDAERCPIVPWSKEKRSIRFFYTVSHHFIPFFLFRRPNRKCSLIGCRNEVIFLLFPECLDRDEKDNGHERITGQINITSQCSIEESYADTETRAFGMAQEEMAQVYFLI